MDKIKTICTIGPASASREVFEQLVLSGMDFARFNMSHKSEQEFLEQKAMVEEFNTIHGKNVQILMDLQGPRMRVGIMPDDGMPLVEGQEVSFTTDSNNQDAIHINDPYLHDDIQVDHPLYLANGDLELQVTEKTGPTFKATVIRGGILHSRKGVNVPETNLTTRGLTEKDMVDVALGVKHGVKYVAMSFVKDAQDIAQLRAIVGPDVKIIAKIEIKQALYNLDEIIKAVDIIMVARGDLGIEVPLETLPLIQKDMITRCKKFGKPAIVATQMLMSMVDHHRPTRAEVSDVANAVLDGAWAVMLSDETAFGKYPVESLRYLVRTAQHTEAFLYRQLADTAFAV